MKNKLWMLMILLLSFALLANAQVASEDYEEEFTVSANSVLMIRSTIGDINIASWDKPVIRIEATKTAVGRQAKEIIKALKYEVERHGNRLIFHVVFPKERVSGIKRGGRNLEVSVDLDIMIPKDCSIGGLNLALGDIILEDISGKIKVNVAKGSVTGDSLAGDISMIVAMGDIELGDVHGEMDLNTTIGSIDLEGVTGLVKAICTSGDLTIHAIDLEGLVAKNNSGDIEVSIDSPLTFGDFHLQSTSGDIDLSLPGASAFHIVAQTREAITSSFKLERLTKRGLKKYSGEFNGGGGAIQVITFTGDITIEK